MEFTFEHLVTAVSSFLMGGAGKWILDIRKLRVDAQSQSHKDELAANEQAFQVYKDLVTRLQSDIQRLEARVEELIKSERECREKNLELSSDIRVLKAQVQTLQTQVSVAPIKSS